MARPLLVLAVLVGAVTPAAAEDLDAAVATIDAGAAADVIARLRPRIAELDASERCALGLAYAGPGTKPKAKRKPDRTRALVYLPSCGGGLPTAIAERGEAARARMVELAERAGDTVVEIVVPAAGVDGSLVVDIDQLAGDVVIAPATVWLPAGSYELRGHAGGNLLVSQLTIGARSSATVLFEVPRPPPPPRGPKQVSFDDGAPEATYVGPPPKQVHKSLLADRYEKGLAANRAAAAVSWSDIPADPHARARIRSTVGLRLGGGVADSAGGGAIGTLSIAAMARAVIQPSWLAGELRLDAGQRGSAAARMWTVGATAQARWYPLEHSIGGLSVAGGARVEIRTADAIDAMAVDRFGLAATAAIGWEPGRKRFAIELRGEQAVSRLAGSRPRAVLLELGFNL
jgi:hypothetical protein